MSEYRLSDEAEHDLAEIYRRGFWKFGEYQADKFYNQLFDSLELLASFPESGRSARNTLCSPRAKQPMRLLFQPK